MAAAAMPMLTTKSNQPRQGAVLIEKFQRASDGARFFVQWRSDEADPSIETRMNFSRNARQVIHLLAQTVPDRRSEVTQRWRTMEAYEHAVTNYQREDGLVVSVFQIAPRLGQPVVRKNMNCPINPQHMAGNGDPASFEGQTASASGQLRGSNNLFYSYTINWEVMRVNNVLTWVEAGGECALMDPQPTTPPNGGGGDGGNGGNNGSTGTGNGGGVGSSGFGGHYCWPTNGGTGVECRFVLV
jgi:hypothetical protein